MWKNWIRRLWTEFHAYNLTPYERDVLLRLERVGTRTPSHRDLAKAARCSLATVKRALIRARNLGLVVWHERRFRVGWRSLRTSNHYTLTIPASAVVPRAWRAGRPKPLPCTKVQEAPVESKISKKEADKTLFATAATLPDLLAARQAAFAQAVQNKLRPQTQSESPHDSAKGGQRRCAAGLSCSPV